MIPQRSIVAIKSVSRYSKPELWFTVNLVDTLLPELRCDWLHFWSQISDFSNHYSFSMHADDFACYFLVPRRSFNISQIVRSVKRNDRAIVHIISNIVIKKKKTRNANLFEPLISFFHRASGNRGGETHGWRASAKETARALHIKCGPKQNPKI